MATACHEVASLIVNYAARRKFAAVLYGGSLTLAVVARFTVHARHFPPDRHVLKLVSLQKRFAASTLDVDGQLTTRGPDRELWRIRTFKPARRGAAMATSIWEPLWHLERAEGNGGDNRQNQLVIEAKQEMAKRGVASPDDADALALTFAHPVVVPRRDEDRYRRYHDIGGEYAWMR